MFKNNSCFVGITHYSPTTNILGGITIFKKTGKGNILLIGCSRIWVKKDLRFQKRWLKTFQKILDKLWRSVANVGSGFASTSAKAASSSLPEAINFRNTGNGLFLGKFV